MQVEYDYTAKEVFGSKPRFVSESFSSVSVMFNTTPASFMLMRHENGYDMKYLQKLSVSEIPADSMLNIESLLSYSLFHKHFDQSTHFDIAQKEYGPECMYITN